MAFNNCTSGFEAAQDETDSSSQPPGTTSGSPQFPNLLNSYAHRPSWQVAGVDYAVGIPAGQVLKDPATISMAGVTLNSPLVIVTGNGVTLDGYDFTGWGVEVRSANVRIVNSKFFITNQVTPVVGTQASSNLYVGYSSFDGNEEDTLWGGLFSYRGNGFTIEYCLLENALGDVIQQIDGGSNSTVIIRNNLVVNGGLAPGTHGDYTQLAGGPFSSLTISYNTSTQTGGSTQGFMTEYVSAGEISHNTMIGDCSYFTSVDLSSLTGTMTVNNNYFANPIYGFVYPNSGPGDGNSKSVFQNNVNMVSGAVTED